MCWVEELHDDVVLVHTLQQLGAVEGFGLRAVHDGANETRACEDDVTTRVVLHAVTGCKPVEGGGGGVNGN